jgi:ABC-2 type transport system ATP-binding protein
LIREQAYRVCERQGALTVVGNTPVVQPDAAVLMSVRSLTKRYGEQVALADVSLSVRRGEVLGIIGPNGAGKTTLLEAIAGIIPADSGTVLWQGARLPQFQRRGVMFYLPDGVRPYGEQYVARVLSFFAGVYRRPKTYVEDVLEAVDLGPFLAKRVITLSKGFNRRLILALGFLAPQPLLLMDEPFDGFDLRQTRQMMHVLRRATASGRTLMLSIHQLSEAERICDRFVLLENGCVRGAGALDDLRAQANLAGGTLEEVFLALA